MNEPAGRPLAQRMGIGLAGGAALLLLSGCGGDGDGDSDGGALIGDSGDAGDSGGGGLPGQSTVTVTLDVTGDVSLSGTTTMSGYPSDADLRPLSCSEYAEGYELEGVHIFPGPAGLDGDIDGKNVLPMIGVFRYDGPGTYTDNLSGHITGEPQIDIDNQGFTLPLGQQSELVVNADGSGSWTFLRLEDPHGESISGSMTWTCEDG